MSKKILILVCFLIITKSLCAMPLEKESSGIHFNYRWLDTLNDYNMNQLSLEGFHSIGSHQVEYDLSHTFGTDNLTSVGVYYAYKNGPHWGGGGISSSGDKPFTRFNLLDFDVFYAYEVFEHTTQYTENTEGIRQAYFSKLYLGIDYSTERILLDGYPLPIIRYEYNTPRINLIFGFPLTYLKVHTLPGQYFEFKYIPVMAIKTGYNIAFDKHNMISMYFEVENKKYRMSSTAADVYYQNQLKYYTQKVLFKFQYSFTFDDKTSLSPYVSFIADSRNYWGKNVFYIKKQKYTGIGYSVGLDINVHF